MNWAYKVMDYEFATTAIFQMGWKDPIRKEPLFPADLDCNSSEDGSDHVPLASAIGTRCSHDAPIFGTAESPTPMDAETDINLTVNVYGSGPAPIEALEVLLSQPDEDGVSWRPSEEAGFFRRPDDGIVWRPTLVEAPDADPELSLRTFLEADLGAEDDEQLWAGEEGGAWPVAEAVADRVLNEERLSLGAEAADEPFRPEPFWPALDLPPDEDMDEEAEAIDEDEDPVHQWANSEISEINKKIHYAYVKMTAAMALCKDYLGYFDQKQLSKFVAQIVGRSDSLQAKEWRRRKVMPAPFSKCSVVLSLGSEIFTLNHQMKSTDWKLSSRIEPHS